MQPRRPPSLPLFAWTFLVYLRFLILKETPHTPGLEKWKIVNLNSRQMWASCKNGYLRNYRSRFKPFLGSNVRPSLLRCYYPELEIVCICPAKDEGQKTFLE
jgi:hypothetical protein